MTGPPQGDPGGVGVSAGNIPALKGVVQPPLCGVLQGVPDPRVVRVKAQHPPLEAYTGLTPDHPLFGRILDVYRALAIAKQ